MHGARDLGDPAVVGRDCSGSRSPDQGQDDSLVSVWWTDVADAMVLRLNGRVAPLADALAEGVAAVVPDAPVILDVRHVGAPADVAVVLRGVAGVLGGRGRVCVVGSTPDTQFGLAVFRTVGDALQAWCLADGGYGSGWR